MPSHPMGSPGCRISERQQEKWQGHSLCSKGKRSQSQQAFVNRSLSLVSSRVSGAGPWLPSTQHPLGIAVDGSGSFLAFQNTKRQDIL